MSASDKAFFKVKVTGAILRSGIVLVLSGGKLVAITIAHEYKEPRWETGWTLASGMLGVVLGILIVYAGFRIVKRQQAVAVPGHGLGLHARGFWIYVVGFLLYIVGNLNEGFSCLGLSDHTSCYGVGTYLYGFIVLVAGALLGLVGVVRIILAVSRPSARA